MLKELYKNYQLEAIPYKTYDKRWAVSVKISIINEGKIQEKTYTPQDKCWYILEIEAAKEAINLGKRLIDKNLVKI